MLDSSDFNNRSGGQVKPFHHTSIHLFIDIVTEPYGFLAFVPLMPSFDGAAFGCLRDISASVCSSYEHPGKFTLSPEKIAQWMDLENLLFLISSLLNNSKNYLLGPSLTPIPPSYLGSCLPFRTPRITRLRATTARDWFAVLMGRISFLLGHFEHENGPDTGVPRWFSFLESHGIPQSWLCSLHASTLCDFSGHCPRVGLFLDFLENPKSNQPQPQVKRDTSLNVPVWHRWTTLHQSAVKE